MVFGLLGAKERYIAQTFGVVDRSAPGRKHATFPRSMPLNATERDASRLGDNPPELSRGITLDKNQMLADHGITL